MMTHMQGLKITEVGIKGCDKADHRLTKNSMEKKLAVTTAACFAKKSSS